MLGIEHIRPNTINIGYSSVYTVGSRPESDLMQVILSNHCEGHSNTTVTRTRCSLNETNNAPL